MFGYNFCKSSCKAVKLIVSNAARAAALDGTTGFMLFIGKLLVGLGAGALTWAFFAGQGSSDCSSRESSIFHGTFIRRTLKKELSHLTRVGYKRSMLIHHQSTLSGYQHFSSLLVHMLLPLDSLMSTVWPLAQYSYAF